MASSLPKQYKAAVIGEKGSKVALKDVDLKQPGKGQVLVKILACGVCHSDDFIRQGHLGDVFPRVPGHEIVGDIVAVGEDVTRFKGGERVGGPWHGGKVPTPHLISPKESHHVRNNPSPSYNLHSIAPPPSQNTARPRTVEEATH